MRTQAMLVGSLCLFTLGAAPQKGPSSIETQGEIKPQSDSEANSSEVAMGSSPEPIRGQTESKGQETATAANDFAEIERLLQITELHITIALAIGGFLVAGLGIFGTLLQQRSERLHRDEWIRWKQDFAADKERESADRDRLRDMQHEALEAKRIADLSDLKASLLDECLKSSLCDVDRRFGLLAEDLKRSTLAQTRFYASEVLMQTPSARGLLLARFRRMCSELEGVLDSNPSALPRVLTRAIQDWHVLGQLFSSDEVELKNGLGVLEFSPVPEARSRLRDLQQQQQGNFEVANLVVMALSALDGRARAES